MIGEWFQQDLQILKHIAHLKYVHVTEYASLQFFRWQESVVNEMHELNCSSLGVVQLTHKELQDYTFGRAPQSCSTGSEVL